MLLAIIIIFIRAYETKFEVNMNKFESVQKLCFFKVIFCQTPSSIDQYSRMYFIKLLTYILFANISTDCNFFHLFDDKKFSFEFILY